MTNRNILIIGNLGYIGPVVARYFRGNYPEIKLHGYDIGYFMQQYTRNGLVGETYLNRQHFGDVRNFDENVLEGIDAVVYLAAISNDPMGNVFEQPTLDINYHAAVSIAQMAKKKGVSNFVFASSCSVYGLADTIPRTELSEVNPLTAYAKSKVYAERELEKISGKGYKVTCLRFATACGYSDRMRLDLVLNDFVAAAIVDKKITILSDGTPWRPLIHVLDMSRAIDWACRRNDEADFVIVNTGSDTWNYQVSDLANAVQNSFGEVEIIINKNALPDKRSYRVNFNLFEKLVPDEFQPRITLSQAIEDIRCGLAAIHFSDKNFRSSNLIRLESIKNLISCKCIDDQLFKTFPVQSRGVSNL